MGVVVEAAMGWLVGSILGILTEKMKEWIQGVGLADDVEELKNAVNSVQMVLAAAKGRKIDNEPLARSLGDLKEMLYDADDVMDELDYYRLKMQVESDNSRAGTPDAANNTAAKSPWLPSSIRHLGSTAFGRIVSTGSSTGKRKREDDHNIAASSHLEILENKSDFSSRIKHIARKLRDLDRDVNKALGIDGSKSAGTSNLGRYHDNPTTSYLVEPKVYGRDEEIESIFKLIENNRSNDITVLPIVGIGGIGKTTLAQFVYKSPMVENQFQIKIWICVSDKFDVTRLIREMLECVSGQKQAETGNLNKLQEDLQKQVTSKRFLIVFDDVWDDMNEDSWNKLLLAPLRRNQAMGNMILVTTRKSSIADMTKTIEPVKLSALERGDFWLLFKSFAFGNEKYEKDEGLFVIGKQIAENLRGNPLAAKTVGRMLKRNINVDNWTNILNNQEWKSLHVKGDIMPVLKLSYDYLPEHLQRCFRYCCLFPKDYHFEEAKLIRMWISQAFVCGRHTGKKQEDEGKGYLAELVDSGFFQHVSDSSHTFVMHDLLHDLACQVSRADIVTIAGSECAEIPPTARHMSIVFDYECSETSENFERKLRQIASVRKLRSLVLIGDYDFHFFDCLNDIFKKAHNLRFLQIEATYSDFGCFISNLGCCNHVRYIDVALFDVFEDIELPQSMINYFHLQVLDVGLETNLTLPHGMSNLVSMQHLVAAEVHSAIANIGKMTALQELPMFMVKVQSDGGFSLRQLQSMGQLVQLGIYQLENVQSRQEASEARLIDKVHLEDVRLSWNDATSTSSGASKETSSNVLEGLRPHQRLKHLQIIGYSGSSLPSWLANDISVTSLQSLHLEKCKELGILPPLLTLPFLRKLELIDLPDIVEVEIPCLEGLKLIELPRLEKCLTTSNSKLNCRLQSLFIENCPQLNDFAPLTSENFCSFEVIHDSGTSKLESDSADHAAAEAEEKKWFPVLRFLRIHGCPRLMLTRHPLPPATNTEVSIEGLSTYTTIKRRSGDFSVKSNDLEVLDAKILVFQNLKDVTSVEIKDCPNLVILSFEGFRQLNNVRYMEIFKCGNMVLSCMTNAVSETWRATACPAFPHLKHLKIESCGGIAVKWLTGILLHVQSLEELDIVKCPIKCLSIQKAESHNLASSSQCVAILPTILAQDELHLHIPLNVLSTLQKFHIVRCPEMQLCGSEGFGGFTSLTRLGIAECPMLFSSADERFSLPPLVSKLRIQHLPKKLQPYFPGNRTLLKELEVHGRDLQSLRLHSCTALERLCIYGCRQLAVLDVDCSLPPLVPNLQIRNSLAKKLHLYFLGNRTFLKVLVVCGCLDLQSLRLHSLTSLESLWIRECRQVTVVLEGLQYLNFLRLLSIEMNPELSAAWVRKCEEVEQRSGHVCLLPRSLEELRICSLQEELSPYLLAQLPCLSVLQVYCSPNLISLQLGSLTALEKLTIGNCDSLASIQGRLSQLEECEFRRQDLSSLQPGSLTALKRLTLAWCTGLASLERHFLGDLTDLEIRRCGSIAALLEPLLRQDEGCSIFPRLERLSVDDLSAIDTSFSKHLTSLCYLNLLYLNGIACFTDDQEKALQLLTSLQELEFQECNDLVDLPAVLYSLHSLKKLLVVGCPYIARLPEKGLPPSLEELEIYRCSAQLKDQCRMLATENINVTIN